MALAQSNSTLEPRSFSIGPIKQQIINISVANGDVSGTVTADALSSVGQVIVTGLDLTAAPTYSGNVITLAFADPLATRHCQLIALGK
jgi:hypothetical protein